MTTNLPAVVPGHWDSEEGAAKAREYVKIGREQLAHGELSDLALANAIFMADRRSPNLLPLQTAAKDRIRWLSVQLAIAQGVGRATELEMDKCPKCGDRVVTVDIGPRPGMATWSCINPKCDYEGFCT